MSRHSNYRRKRPNRHLAADELQQRWTPALEEAAVAVALRNGASSESVQELRERFAKRREQQLYDRP